MLELEDIVDHRYRISSDNNNTMNTIQPETIKQHHPLHSSYTSTPTMIILGTSSSIVNNNETTKDESSSSSVVQQQQQQTTTTTTIYPSWHNTIAGAVAGAGSRMATAPLDLIRIRRQLMTSGIVTYPTPSLYTQLKNVVQTEGGINALYRGNVAAIYLWISYAAVQFTTYNATKDILLHTSICSSSNNTNNSSNTTTRLLCESPTVVAFISGAVAGVCATALTYPFDICRTIFVAQGNIVSETPSLSAAPTTAAGTATTVPTKNPPKSFAEFISKLYQKQGIKGFYAGAFPAMIQVVPYMGINFAIYDRLTRTTTTGSLNDSNSTNTTTSNNTSVTLSAYAGSISGAVSKILIYPLDTVKRRLQAQAFFGTVAGQHHYYTNMMDCFYSIYTQEGIYSFYRGMVPSVLKTTVSTALTFALYRFTKNLLENIHDHHYNPILQMEESLHVVQHRSTTPRNESSN